MSSEIKCLRIGKMTSSKRKADKSNNETLKFLKQKGDIIIETEYYIYRMNFAELQRCLVTLN